MRTRLRSLNFHNPSVPLALLAFCLLVFGPLIYNLGFYWDDWPSIWFLHNWGPAGFRQSFASDRPLMAWVFMLTTPLMGESTLRWQLFGLAARWLAGLTLWWTLLGLWPRRWVQVFWAALLFTIYPGFSQQYIAVTYSNAFLFYTLFILSLGCMVWAYRKLAWFWPLTILSLVCGGLSMLLAEYFYGLELLRPALLWLVVGWVQPSAESSSAGASSSADVPSEVLSRQRPAELVEALSHPLSRRQKLYKVLLGWAPYLALAAPYVLYRAFFTHTPRGEITLFSQLSSAPPGSTLPLTAVLGLLQTIVRNFLEVNFLAWFSGLNPAFLSTFEPNVLIIGALTVLAAMGLAFFYLLRLGTEPPTAAAIESEVLTRERQAVKKWAWQAIFLGIYGFLVGGATIWVTNLHIELLFPWDRFTLITMIPTSLLIAGLIGLLARRRWQSALLLSLLVGLSAGVQFQQRLVYRQEWLAQRNFFWQLVWRAPGIQPGTTLLTSEIPFTYYSDNSLSAPLNWIYAPRSSDQGGTAASMPYLLYDIEARLGTQLPSIEAGLPISMPYRITAFEGSTDQALVLFYDPPRCVKVMDPQIDRYLPVKPLYIREATPLSRPELILPQPAAPAVPPPALFGAEPPHTWCYFFEKAELYNQAGDYPKAAQAADQALKLTKHFTEKNISELIPFIEAYAHTGQWKKAGDLTFLAYQTWDKTQYALCDVWRRIETQTPTSPERQANLERINTQFGCKISQ